MIANASLAMKTRLLKHFNNIVHSHTRIPQKYKTQTKPQPLQTNQSKPLCRQNSGQNYSQKVVVVCNNKQTYTQKRTCFNNTALRMEHST